MINTQKFFIAAALALLIAAPAQANERFESSVRAGTVTQSITGNDQDVTTLIGSAKGEGYLDFTADVRAGDVSNIVTGNYNQSKLALASTLADDRFLNGNMDMRSTFVARASIERDVAQRVDGMENDVTTGIASDLDAKQDMPKSMYTDVSANAVRHTVRGNGVKSTLLIGAKE